MRLGCLAVETFIEAGLGAKADVRQAYAAGWTVVFGTAEGRWRNG
jgi:hypothetical protein